MDKNLMVQLQEVADDSNIKVLGQLVLGKGQTSNTADSFRWFIFIADGPVTARNLDGINMTQRYPDESATATEFSWEAGRHSLLLTEDAQRVILESKYNITELRIGNTLFFDDVADMAFMPAPIYSKSFDSSIATINGGNLNKLSYLEDGSIDWEGSDVQGEETVLQFGNSVTGDIVNLKKFRLGSPIHLRLRNSNVYGDLSVFADCDNSFKTNMRQVSLNAANKGKVYGNIESFEDYTNIDIFSIQGGVSIFGSVVTALSNSNAIREIAIDTSTGAEDLAPMFDAWYNAGRTSGTCHFWIPDKTVNNVSVHEGIVTFTSNGWTIQKIS